MEGAGASIVSHAAELATRDTYKQLELPSAIQDLVRRLEGQGEPITRLPDLSGPEFVKFFPRGEPLSAITEWRSKVRIRVLEAIGRCNTLEVLCVCDIFGGYGRVDHISMLTSSEWDMVLRGFRSSTVLREISTEGCMLGPAEERESWCLKLETILKTSSVTVLRIIHCTLNARCFSILASGLRGNPDSKLQSLELSHAWDSSALKHVADMINSAPLLQTLCIRGPFFISEREDVHDENFGMLSQALIQSSSFKELRLEYLDWGHDLLLRALARADGNRSIERLVVQCSNYHLCDEYGGCLRKLLTCNPSLKEVEVNTLRMRRKEWRKLGEVIRDNAVATTIFKFESCTLVNRWKSIEALAWAACSDVKLPTVELHIDLDLDYYDSSYHYNHTHMMLSLNLLGRVLRGENTSLKSLSISARDKKIITFSILPMDGKSREPSVLKRLELSVRSKYLTEGAWEGLVCCMRGNHLTHLDLSDSELHEGAFRDLMGVLQVNLALQEIEVSRTSWASDGKAAQIQEGLNRNQKRAVYMSAFREAKLAFGDAKAGRLFLCGSPRAGKTQLRKTLMSINQGKSWLGITSVFNKWDALWRTKGIEVEVLQNNDKMQISVWDLAGQWIFHTLQNVLFPQTNSFCVFLFVYSPFCEKTSSYKPVSCFRLELEDWLSFITSSIQVTGHDLPQVFVVISHKDKAKYNSLAWAYPIVEKLTKRFANFVDLRPIQECFHVDARKKKQVIPLNCQIFENFNKLLKEKSPQVPQLCTQLTSLLVTNTKKNKSCPLWDSKNFHDFCAPSLTQYIPSSSAHSDDHSRIMESIISYLNDVGSIIYIPNLDYIIVEPNWLTNTFLGELIALGQHFQAQECEYSCRTSSYTSKDGIVSDSVFAQLIEEFLRNQPDEQRGVDKEKLENILVNLDLCFKLKDTSQYFIPSFIPEHASMEEHKHQEGAHLESMYWENTGETSQFVGIRIECKDERTMSLTAAFFPRFQVRLDHDFI
ncbi:hypothetical protein MPTK1_6g12745 [Marchantia polymorpha subsp. ruderalis]